MGNMVGTDAVTGTGWKVDENRRLHTQTVSIDSSKSAAEKGRAYNINSGWVTLTDAADTPLLYIKNNETNDVHITAFAIGLDTATNGTATELATITIVRNPKTGTIITSTPTDAPIISNNNFGSTDTFVADVYIGATGDTMTDGTDHAKIGASDFNRVFANLDVVLPKGSSIGIKIDPPANSDSFPVYVAAILHVEDPKDE